jgi:uncharacterized membrane protein YfcA
MLYVKNSKCYIEQNGKHFIFLMYIFCDTLSLMDILYILFPISGVKTWVFLPPLVALLVSSFTSMAGVSGAFILLPFQMSVLGFTSPAVSSTNFVYNIVAIPSGIYRYFKEGRMAWPLTWIIIAGTLPGVFFGYYLRILYLPNPRSFKFFVGLVLLYIGGRLLYEVSGKAQSIKAKMNILDQKFAERARLIREKRYSQAASGLPPEAVIKTVAFNLKTIEYEFWGERFRFSVPAMFLLAFVVGVIGGTYGIGGGAIIAPFCVAVFHLPVYTVAGAALFGTFLTSIVGVIFYSILPKANGLLVSPDWVLGFLFGIGGFIGMYIGARLQKYIPQKHIKVMLGVMIVSLAIWYITQYFVQ